jgi:ABC-type enterochelin transport system substrate-binding protein
LKQIIKNIFAIYLIASLTFGVGGIELFRHVCSSHSLNEVSIVDKPKCEHPDTQTYFSDDCCSEVSDLVEQTSCCEDYDNIETKSNLVITNSEECCESYSELKKIEELLYPPVEKKVLIGFFHFENIHISDLFDNQSELNSNFQNKDIPNPISGRTLLNHIHQLKIDTPIC